MATQAQTATVTTLAPSVPEPNYGVMQASDGNYYSTTPPGVGGELICDADSSKTCSYIYKITPAGVVTVLHTFEVDESSGLNTEGGSPTPLVEGADGALYGTCTVGGSGGIGTIFRITTDGILTVLFTFAPNSSGWDVNGAQPGALALGNDGNFYGVTGYGGDGTVGGPSFFRITPDGAYLLIHRFTQADGASPYVYAPGFVLVQALDGNFYGAGSGCTDSPCMSNTTVLYSISPGGVVTVVNRLPQVFDSGGVRINQIVSGPFTVGPDGAFYGVSLAANQANGGAPATTFRFTSYGNFQTLSTFSTSAQGLLPDQRLTLGSDGNLYGTTREGGDVVDCPVSSGCGTFFQQSLAEPLITLHMFHGQDGGGPEGPTAQIGDGTFVSVNNGATTTGGPTAGIAYDLALSPALPAPIQITFNPKTVPPNTPTTLTWSVLNAFSASAQQCHASVLGLPPGADEAHWIGPQTGSMNGNIYSGSATITPTSSGTYTYVLNCGGVETGSATLVIGNPVQILTASLPSAIVSKPYTIGMSATGGVTPYKWGYSGVFPAGLAIDSTTGVISGTPKQFGVYQVTIGAQDSSSPPQIATTTLQLTIDSGLSLVGSLNNGVVDTAYNVTATATGGLGPYKWSLTSGKLPDGLTLNTTTGVISGTPTVVGNYAFVISVSDSEGTPATLAQPYTISTAVPPLAIETTHFDCTVQVLCAGSFEATGGTPPYTWVLIPDPSGAVFDNFPSGVILSSNGSFAGKPLQATQTTPTIQVTDSATPAVTVTGHGSFNIVSGLKIVSITLPPATLGVAYQAPPPVATGGLTPYRWVVTGSAFSQITAEYYVPQATGAITSQGSQGPVTPGTFTLLYTVYDAEGVPSYAEANATLVVSLPTVTSVTTLSSLNSSAGTGMTIALTAKVSATAGTPTGIVTFYNGSAVLGTATLDTTGTATLQTNFSVAGVYTLTASYGGGGAITGSISAPIAETVVTPTLSASFSPGTLTIGSGKSGSLTVTLTPTGGYAGTVALTCGTLPAHVYCSFAPSLLTIASGTTSATSVLTVSISTTNLALLTSPKSGGEGKNPLLAFALCSPLFTLSLFGIRRRKKSFATFFGACLLMLVASGLVGCGSTSNTTAKPGTYSIPIVLKLADGTTIAANTTLIVQ
ncbi:MAG: choice-of-anchor tandem repeat GloVer-containing protein [Granulicella sp.]